MLEKAKEILEARKIEAERKTEAKKLIDKVATFDALIADLQRVGQALLAEIQSDADKLMETVKKGPVDVKEVLEIQDGHTYWVIVGDMQGWAGKHHIMEVKAKLLEQCPGAKFIVTTPNIRPVSHSEVQLRRKPSY